MSDYIDDPELLNKLNAGAPPSKDDYVTDPDLINKLNQGALTEGEQLYSPPATGVDSMLTQAAAMVPGAARAWWEGPAKGLSRDAADLAKIIPAIEGMSAEELKKLISDPRGLFKAYIQGHPWYDVMRKPLSIPGSVAGGIGRGVLGAVAAPESIAMMPYAMAGYEQEKIRANPNAPQYQSNPYAMAVRKEYPTQGAAGAANQRQALINMPNGPLNAQEQAVMDKYKSDQLQMAIRLKAARKVLGQP
jgi:hypothetical protein